MGMTSEFQDQVMFAMSMQPLTVAYRVMRFYLLNNSVSLLLGSAVLSLLFCFAVDRMRRRTAAMGNDTLMIVSFASAGFCALVVRVAIVPAAFMHVQRFAQRLHSAELRVVP